MTKLSKIRPQEKFFFLESLPGKPLSYKKMSLQDFAWIEQTTGKPLADVLKNGEATMLLKMIYHQLTNECKEHFPAYTKESFLDDDGERVEAERVPGYIALAEAVGTEEITALIEHYVQHVGLHTPNQKEKKTKKKVIKKRIGA